MVDKTTEISVKKQLGLVVRVLHLGRVSAGDAATLYDSILRVIKDDNMLPTDKLASFASDGAAGEKLELGRDSFPGLITVHCVAHRLNLAVSDCIKRQRVVHYLTKYARPVGTIFWFYQASSNRTSSLKDLERHFELSQIKLPNPWRRCFCGLYLQNLLSYISPLALQLLSPSQPLSRLQMWRGSSLHSKL
ncbi:zinc finger protein 862-like [Entelurus aequoreus]|uniref:zinc finger protein 862-like n=1 Tax=Entelurus aequoreus TaxID=161455 RepID=UPI002B1E5B61|nr:zinc finger protein 862-like [Entelurus aequoreus]